MKNTIFKDFGTTITGTDALPTVVMQKFTKSLLWERPVKYDDSNYYTNYVVQNGERLEVIAHSQYGNLNYWDVIAFFNNLSSLDQLPQSTEIIVERADVNYNRWLSRHGQSASTAEKKAKEIEFYEKANSDNEEYRTIKLLNQSYISEYISILKG